jgi:GNAT superfamily N-acetyltransferase
MARELIGLETSHLAQLSRDCGGCMFWESAVEHERRCGVVCDPEGLGDWMRTIADEWGPPGRAALEDGELLGFIKYAPARYFPQSHTFDSLPEGPDTVLLTCLHIRTDARHHGLGRVLVHAMLRDLVSRGERRVEAFACARPTEPIEEQPMVSVEFLVRNGFSVEQPDPLYPLMRLELRSLATVADNLEAVFESLRFPRRAPQRVPAHWIQGR